MLDLGIQPRSLVKPLPAGASIEYHRSSGGWFGAVLIVLVGLATGMVFFADRASAVQLTRLQNSLNQLHQQIATGSLGMTATQARALAVAGSQLVVSAQRAATWSALLKDFQVTTMPGVTLKTFSIDDKNNLRIDGETGSFSELASYLATLRASTHIRAVDLISSSADTASVGNPKLTFSLAIIIKTDLLRTSNSSAGTL